jgi:hypothetical protein
VSVSVRVCVCVCDVLGIIVMLVGVLSINYNNYASVPSLGINFDAGV